MRLEKSATRGTGPGRREYKTVQFELEKYDEEQGIVSGYASVFGNVDDGGDVVEPGAFAESIAEGVGRVKILALHNDCWLPVGRPLVLKEDTKGLYFEAKISDTALGRDVKTLIRDGVLTEFSIGYDPIEFEFDATGIRHLRKVKLWEISIVTWAMNPEATVTDYKQQKQTTEEVHMRLENNATGPSAGKSMSMGTDELKEIVKAAVKEAKEGAASDDDSPSDSDELKELIKSAVKEGLADDGSGDPRLTAPLTMRAKPMTIPTASARRTKARGTSPRRATRQRMRAPSAGSPLHLPGRPRQLPSLLLHSASTPASSCLAPLRRVGSRKRSRPWCSWSAPSSAWTFSAGMTPSGQPTTPARSMRMAKWPGSSRHCLRQTPHLAAS